VRKYLIGVLLFFLSLAVLKGDTAAVSVEAEQDADDMVASRQEQIEKEREQKARHLIPAAPSRAELLFTKYEFPLTALLATPSPGLRPKFSSSAPDWGGLVLGSGFSLGPEYYRPDLAKGNVYFRTSAIGTTKLNYLFDAQLRFPQVANNRLTFDFLGRYKAERSINYYGEGPDSQKGNRTDYSKESTEFDFLVGWKPTLRHLQMGVRGGLLLVNVGPGINDALASTESVFGPAEAPGIDQQTNFWWGGPFVRFDTTNRPNMPTSGSVIEASFDYYDDYVFNTYSFRLLNVNLQKYFPFFNEKRVIALRATTAISFANPNQLVPFYLQQTVGGPDDLRGFRLFRFTDYNNLVLNGEYRWEIFPALDMALFTDSGKVFNQPGDFKFSDLEVDGGFGFRFKSRDSVVMRLDVGFSHEGFQIWFRYSGVY
jgi:outer membrane protein assembly factor BamA